jgi:hypothetical protein
MPSPSKIKGSTCTSPPRRRSLTHDDEIELARTARKCVGRYPLIVVMNPELATLVKVVIGSERQVQRVDHVLAWSCRCARHPELAQ